MHITSVIFFTGSNFTTCNKRVLKSISVGHMCVSSGNLEFSFVLSVDVHFSCFPGSAWCPIAVKQSGFGSEPRMGG